MRITLAETFQRDVRMLDREGRARLFEVVLALPEAFREPQRHAGLGLRKLHASQFWEARIGLGLRLVLALGKDEAMLVRVGSHDEVRRYLATL